MSQLINCSKVIAKDCGDDKGVGVYANQDIPKDDIVEYGLMRRVDTDGNKNSYLYDKRTIYI